MATRAAVLVAAAELSSTLVAAPAEASPGRDHAAEAFSATNDVRDSRERRRLDRDRCLQRHAVRHARRMAEDQQMRHQGLRAVLRACDLGKVGENVAYGYDDGQDAVRAWMGSASHRRNLLDREYRIMGIASRKGEDGNFYTCQLLGVR